MRLALKPLLDSRGMTQTALAEKIDVSRGYMSLLVNNEREPSAAVLAKLAEALDVKPGELFEGGSASGGFEEVVTPYRGKTEATAALLALLREKPNAPMLYTLKTDALGLGYLRGDILITDMNRQPLSGDIVLVTRATPDGNGQTRIARWSDPWLIDATPSTSPSRLDETNTQAILAVVLGSVRGL